MSNDAKRLINQMTIEEKAFLCSGKDFWKLKSNERLGISSIMVSDGPHGLRKQSEQADNLGIAQSIETTCFPTASATGSSWDVDLMHEIGEALASTCIEEGIEVLLGPGVNIKRSPLCGRNFEYISEDPYHTGAMGAAFVKGVQSLGVGTALKHFVANNQEYRRMAIESVVDERTLREIYLAGFEKIVKEAQPYTVMCAYNKVDGLHCSDNKRLLTDILRSEWGHAGLVMTDWGACNDRVEGIKAGLELEMPYSGGRNDNLIVEAIKTGELSLKDLDKSVERIINLVFKCKQTKKATIDGSKRNQLARKAAGQSIVLLKNQDNILPLSKESRIAVVGEFSKEPRYQGAGSSYINPSNLQSAIDELDKQKISYLYARGYHKDTSEISEELVSEAKRAAMNSDAVVVFAGLTDEFESEGYDREHLNLPNSHNVLIEEIVKVSDNVIVVLQNGSPVLMPWLDKVQAVVECYLGGQQGGPAAVDVLFGDVNPSGKLAETFPAELNSLTDKYYGMGPKTVEYRESVYVGYRYYDSAKLDVLFPFGHGLSYTKYEYSDMQTSSDIIKDNETLKVTCRVKNIGHLAGAEVVQLYVKDIKSTIFRPEKELKGFRKIWLEPGEEKQVEFILKKRAFAYYNVNYQDWHVESGKFDILIGASSRDVRIEKQVYINSTNLHIKAPSYIANAKEYYDIANSKAISNKSFMQILGKEIPRNKPKKKELLTLNSTLGDASKTFLGRMLLRRSIRDFNTTMQGLSSERAKNKLVEAVAHEMTIRGMILMGTGNCTYNRAKALLMIMNNKPFRGIIALLNSALNNKKYQ